jgi:hypothetical protein
VCVETSADGPITGFHEKNAAHAGRSGARGRLDGQLFLFDQRFSAAPQHSAILGAPDLKLRQ